MTDIIENKTLNSILNSVIDRRLSDCHVCLPAKVTKYNHSTQKANVQPLIKEKYSDGDQLDLPIITDVPICQLNANNCFIYIPIKVDDLVMLHFSDYSIDNFILNGGLSNSDDLRTHSLNDCFAVPMMITFKSPLSLSNANDLIINNDDLTITVKNNGKIKIENDTGDEIIDLLSQLCATCALISCGGDPTTNAADFTTLKGKVDTFKG